MRWRAGSRGRPRKTRLLPAGLIWWLVSWSRSVAIGVVSIRGTNSRLRSLRMIARLRAASPCRIGQVVEVDLDHVTARLMVEQAEAVVGGTTGPVARCEVQGPGLAVERDGDPTPTPGLPGRVAN